MTHYNHSRLFFLIIFGLFFTDTAGAEALPEWIEPRFDYETLLKRDTAARPNDIMIFSDVQMYQNRDGLWSYFDKAFRIVNQQMVAGLGQITISYLKEAEEAKLIRVERIRNGQAQDITNQLGLKSGSEGSMFTGLQARTQIMDTYFLPDIQIGDIVRLHTLGRNFDPDFKSTINQTIALFDGGSVEAAAVSVRLGAKKYVKVKPIGWSAKPDMHKVGSDAVHVWRTQNENAAILTKPVPYDYVTSPLTSISTFKRWADVGAWAQARFTAGADDDEIKTAAKRMTRGASDKADKVRAIALHMQSIIRYQGGELGRHGFIPRAPAQVLSSRFGDCKDQTMLAIALLKAVDIEAYPALVNSTAPGLLEHVLPGVAAFNHVIVHIKDVDGIAWFDPAYPAVTPNTPYLGYLTYRKALIVDGKSKKLTEIKTAPHPDHDYTAWQRSFLSVIEGGYEESLLAFAYNQFFGALGSLMMQSYAAATPEQLEAAMTAALNPSLPGKLVGSNTDVYADEQGVAHVTTRVTLQHAWKRNKDKDGYRLNLWFSDLDVVTGLLDEPTSLHPVALSHPHYICQDFIVYIPSDWDTPLKNVSIDNNIHRFELSTIRKDDHLDLRMEYEVKADRLKPSQFADYEDDLENIRQNLGYKIEITDTQYDAMVSAQKALHAANADALKTPNGTVGLEDFKPEFTLPKDFGLR